jgi:hypothetical protein
MSIAGSDCQIPPNEICGAIYKQTPPAKNMVLQASNESGVSPPVPASTASWNHLEIWFMSPRYADTVKKKKATVSVRLNSEYLHEKQGINTNTGQKAERSMGEINDNVYGMGWKKAIGPVVLQEHDNRVEFKEILINPTHSFATDFQVDA